jgi:rhodanese-related sulfurtransferase
VNRDKSRYGYGLAQGRAGAILTAALLTVAPLLAQEPVGATNLPAAAAVATNALPTNLVLRVITAEVLRTMLQQTNDFVLIDVMPPLYYRDFHIKGAMSIPEKEIAATVASWPRYRRIVVYCLDQECETSRDVAVQLMKMGFLDVFQYGGGKREWRAKKYESMGPGKLLDD